MAKTISLYGFPTVEPPDDIKEFLEEYSGEGTVVAVHVAQPKSAGSRTNAIVEFTTSEAAQNIKLKSLDDEGLWYGNSYLKARDVYRDTVPMRKACQTQYSMDNITLHFGCQVSKEKFSVLWTQKDVSVKFGVELRKFHFFLTHLSKNYKLELSYENIFQIELHRPRGKTKKDLLVQV
jgi:RNA-dependent RNA polymerase